MHGKGAWEQVFAAPVCVETRWLACDSDSTIFVRGGLPYLPGSREVWRARRPKGPRLVGGTQQEVHPSRFCIPFARKQGDEEQGPQRANWGLRGEGVQSPGRCSGARMRTLPSSWSVTRNSRYSACLVQRCRAHVLRNQRHCRRPGCCCPMLLTRWLAPCPTFLPSRHPAAGCGTACAAWASSPSWRRTRTASSPSTPSRCV